MEATPAAKPTVAVHIVPTGRRETTPREYLVTIVVQLSALAPKFADPEHVSAVTREALGAFVVDGTVDRREIHETLTAKKPGKNGIPVSVTTGVEGSVSCTGRPTTEDMDRLRATLQEDGYRVAVIEERTCHEAGCMSVAMLDWSRPSQIPPTWYNEQICGRHNYKTCPSCASVFVLTSSNAAGQGPSLHCSVCGSILVEWGSSKVWEAELVSSGRPSSQPT